ncbi:MAG TPA: helix-turn-helix domain-containing protein [Gemmatimonadaceae bacterium]|nr:helix-turn-helix domain-containing protein [Gemmatimonadaceae bacterium]
MTSDDTPSLSERDLPPCGCGAPGEASAATCYCGVEDLLRIIRRRYSLAVMNAIHGHPTPRYHDVACALPGISSSTLAETLRALEAAQLLSRQPGGDDSPFPTYRLTDSGEKLLTRLRQLLAEL